MTIKVYCGVNTNTKLLSTPHCATSSHPGEDVGQPIDDRYRVKLLTSTNEFTCGEHAAVEAFMPVAARIDLSRTAAVHLSDECYLGAASALKSPKER